MRRFITHVCLSLSLAWMTWIQAFASEPAVPHPSEQEMIETVRRLLGPKQDPRRCQVVQRATLYSIECRNTECHACDVTHVITTLKRKNGTWIVGSTRRERRGDTGECGCCM